MRHGLEEGVSEALSSLVEDVDQTLSRNMSGGRVLHDLLNAPWLHALLKMYECLVRFQRSAPSPFLPYASGLSHEVMAALQQIHRPSAEAAELFSLLSCPHVQAVLSSHDAVAQADYGPVLPPLPDDLPEDEEAMRIVCLVKNNQPLGATIKRNDKTGDIYIARVIHGGLADRSGLLHPGDVLLEVNGSPVGGLEPEQVIHMLVRSHGATLFKVIPDAAQSSSSHTPVFMRAMVDYSPLQDASSPCPDAGMCFSRGDLLEVVDQSDALWWQARKLPCSTAACAGLIPSASMLKSKQREQWWCRPSQGHVCIKPLGDDEDDQTHTDEKRTVDDLEELNFDEADSDFTDGIYLAGFRRSFRLWRRTSFRKRRQSCTSCSSSTLSTPYEEVALYQRPPQENHRLIVLVGATGVGVNELRKKVIKLNPSTFQSPVPHTSRPVRAGEEPGREYHFITKDLFQHMVCNHRFVEYGESKGQLYGTSIDAIHNVLKRGRMCIIDVEPHSIQRLRTKELKPFVIFIKAPSAERLRQTRTDARVLSSSATNRTFSEILQRRFSLKEEDFVELEETSRLIEDKYRQFFDSVILNENLQDTCMQLCSLIQQAQHQPQWTPVSWSREDE